MRRIKSQLESNFRFNLTQKWSLKGKKNENKGPIYRQDLLKRGIS
jgi:hypothetical protein